jgi:RNA polymerase sigma-70 factor (ECF subfamily)
LDLIRVEQSFPSHNMANMIAEFFRPSDEQLMWRVKLQDDAQAFAGLMQRWGTPIERLCARMTGDTHRAEDLAQAAFTRVFAVRAEWQPTGKFSTFLWQIALNLCRDELRKVKRRAECPLDTLDESGESGLDALPSDDASPAVQAETNERAGLVRQAVLRLPSHYREVVVLRHYEQLKFREIGDVLGIPEGTVKSRMAEALTQLNVFLKNLNESPICNPRTQTPELLAL